ncbi:hypothetical protein V1264_002143 [Littorina saxatilis]
MASSLQDMEIMLYEAIATGNLSSVKRMVNSGIGHNAVLHSPKCCDAATILSTAAYFGNLQMVQYLVEAGASVNYQDPGVRRNALHWACMGNGADVVKYLISCDADVNALDRNNISPLMHAAMHSHEAAVRELVQAGACVNYIDRLRCSALHYAAFHRDRLSVRALILGGCIHNNAIFVKGTPLGTLASIGDVENVKLLLAAGCRVTPEDWKQQAEGLAEDSNVGLLMQRHVGLTPSLRHLCRTSIRASMKGQDVQNKIQLLPLPASVIQYLLLELED